MGCDCKQCAIDCVGTDTLKQYQKQFDQCNKNLDVLFESDTEDDDFYRKVIEAGRIYETGYPKCICWKRDDNEKCECSRQALLFLYSQLLPMSDITVETVQTIKDGADSCIFRIILK